ncbi:MAG TPA: alpha/beta hydrolase [Acidimicrobiales bacterium]|nr:alpha/beta hydrolase [Acidimicrobiales bacterium]
MPTAHTDDGVDIAWHDLGGSGPDLLLAHATGFCAAVWEPIARHLTDRFRVVTFDERGHGASGRAPGGNYEWHGFASDALAVLATAQLDRPFAAGHSCGGALLLLAEQHRPSSFAALWCFEPIVFPFTTPPGRNNPLAARARRRTAEFASREDALANYRNKRPLNALHPDVLAAYVRDGFVDAEGCVRLACEPEDEARTYEMGSQHDAYDHLDGVRCPVALLCGEHTDAITPSLLDRQAERLPRATTDVWRDHGHFGPLVDPERAAASIAASFAAG